MQRVLKGCHELRAIELLDLEQEPVGRMGLDVLHASFPRDGDAGLRLITSLE